jgi:hypothetical protein
MVYLHNNNILARRMIVSHAECLRCSSKDGYFFSSSSNLIVDYDKLKTTIDIN